MARIVKYHKPKVIFLENVKNLIRHDGGKTLKVIINTLQELGYDVFYKVLRSSDFEVPQARERIYIVSFRKDFEVSGFEFPKSTTNTKVVKDILEPSIKDKDKMVYINRKDLKIYGDEKAIKNSRRPLQIGVINKGGQGERIYSTHSAGITLSAYGGGAASKTGAYLVNGKIRKLTPRECARMQGFPESFIIPLNKNIAYKQFGDSVSVPVLQAIFNNVLNVVSLFENKGDIIKRITNKSPRQLSFEVLNV